MFNYKAFKISALLFCCILIFTNTILAQGVIVSDNSNTPHPSAMLDISSLTKGLLPPRMSTNQRLDINTPATGLLVYDTDLKKLMSYNGASWAVLGESSNLYNSDGTLTGDRIIGMGGNDIEFLTDATGRFIIDGNYERGGGPVYEKRYRFVATPQDITYEADDYIIIVTGGGPNNPAYFDLPPTNPSEYGRIIIIKNQSTINGPTRPFVWTTAPIGVGNLTNIATTGFLAIISDGTNWYSLMIR